MKTKPEPKLLLKHLTEVYNIFHSPPPPLIPKKTKLLKFNGFYVEIAHFLVSLY